MKQDIVVADATATARLTVWEEVGSLEEMQSYKLSGIMVREYSGKNFLSTSKENSTITKIDDIGPVVDEVRMPLENHDVMALLCTCLHTSVPQCSTGKRSPTLHATNGRKLSLNCYEPLLFVLLNPCSCHLIFIFNTH
jgi:hypothetical protein